MNALNPFLFGLSDAVLIKGTPVEHMFLFTKAERDITQGISVFLGEH